LNSLKCVIVIIITCNNNNNNTKLIEIFTEILNLLAENSQKIRRWKLADCGLTKIGNFLKSILQNRNLPSLGAEMESPVRIDLAGNAIFVEDAKMFASSVKTRGGSNIYELDLSHAKFHEGTLITFLEGTKHFLSR
jgi:hypothetical protein